MISEAKEGDACRNCFAGAMQLTGDMIRQYADQVGVVAARLRINACAHDRDDLWDRSVIARSNAATLRNLYEHRIERMTRDGRGRLVAIAGGEFTLEEILVCNCCGEPHEPDQRSSANLRRT